MFSSAPSADRQGARSPLPSSGICSILPAAALRHSRRRRTLPRSACVLAGDGGLARSFAPPRRGGGRVPPQPGAAPHGRPQGPPSPASRLPRRALAGSSGSATSKPLSQSSAPRSRSRLPHLAAHPRVSFHNIGRIRFTTPPPAPHRSDSQSPKPPQPSPPPTSPPRSPPPQSTAPVGSPGRCTPFPRCSAPPASPMIGIGIGIGIGTVVVPAIATTRRRQPRSRSQPPQAAPDPDPDPDPAAAGGSRSRSRSQPSQAAPDPDPDPSRRRRLPIPIPIPAVAGGSPIPIPIPIPSSSAKPTASPDPQHAGEAGGSPITSPARGRSPAAGLGRRRGRAGGRAYPSSRGCTW